MIQVIQPVPTTTPVENTTPVQTKPAEEKTTCDGKKVTLSSKQEDGKTIIDAYCEGTKEPFLSFKMPETMPVKVTKIPAPITE